MTDNPLALLDDTLRARRVSFDRIPIIDLAPLVDGSNPTAVAREIREALSSAGFMYVKNHGIEPGLVERTFDAAKAFFDLPEQAKMDLHIRHSGPALRGYIELFGENTDPGKTLDLKECIDLGPEASLPATPFFGPNPWPAQLPDFGPTVMAYHGRLVELAQLVLRGIALSLDLPQAHFASMMQRPISILRLLHYPPQTGAIDERVIGIGAHTDYGNLTILAQDDVGGLQVMNRDGHWVEAPPIPDTFVVNIGDLIQRMTNNRYLANLHRVVNASGRERYSIPFFLDADFDAVIAPLSSCVDAETPRAYDPVTCGAHKWARFKASYAHLAETV
ncbi:MAG: 2-oxoglutarate and iron-dependent oxygenase domain-containing protein [Pseudomonadota bacterium]